MKKKRFLTLAAFLTATIAILLGLTWLDSYGVSEPALAASPDTTPRVLFLTDNSPVSPGELPGPEGESAEGSAAGYWVTECADCPKNIKDPTDRSLSLDADGRPHIAYGGDHLYYAWYDGAVWHYETVDNSDGVGTDTSLALDQNGYPHISYVDRKDYLDKRLKYAYKDASGWHIEEVAELYRDLTPSFNDTSLALDSEGNPRISYKNVYLYFAYKDDADWHSDFVVAHRIGTYISLVVDDEDEAHIAYSDGGSLKHIYQVGSGWTIETVDSAGTVGGYPSLVLDSSGNLHVSYHDATNDDLKYAYQDTDGWHNEIAVSEGSVGGYTSLGLDDSGYAHVGYQGPDRAVDYAYKDASGWHSETVYDAGSVYDISIAVDHSGRAHISFLDKSLYYAYHDESGWHIQTADGDVGFVGEYASLALDDSGHAHISYFDDKAYNLRYAYRDAAGWHVQVVDAKPGVGKHTSLALDEDGYPHISYFDSNYFGGDTDDLKYAYLDASGWHTQTVDSDKEAGLYTSLALDQDGYAHISYFEQDYGTLRYAFQNASGWTVETLDSAGDVGLYSSLVLDDNGYAHISYLDYVANASDLKYTYQDSEGWHLGTYTPGDIGWYTSLALDSEGYPHISCYDGSEFELKYVYSDDSGWYGDTVDTGAYTGKYTSLALDADDYPHISYYDDYHGYLKYAYQDSEGWHKQILDGGWDVGQYTSLVLDSGGYPHIAYHDAVNGYLKYTYFAGQPTADFFADPTTGPWPLTVDFDDNSTGMVNSWLWSFGDSITSTLRNPTHTYTATGEYTVALSVSGPGGSDSINRIGYITVREPIPVQAAFTAAPTRGAAPLTVDFTNTSTGDYSTNLWDFGDSVTSTLESPTHIYTTIGAYTVSLTVSGAGGSDTETEVGCITALDENEIYLPLTLRDH